MSIPLSVVILGLISGMTYGLLSVGLVLVYRSSRIINFGHGEVGAFAAAIFGSQVVKYDLPYWLLFPLAVAVGAGAGMLIEVVAVRRLRKAPAMMSILATLGAASFLFALGFAINTTVRNGANYPQPPGMPTLTVGKLVITPAYSAQLIMTPILVLLIAYFLRYTRFGIAIRASADNRDNATMRGINPGRMSLLAWAIAGGLAAYAGILQAPSQGFAVSGQSLGPGLLVRALLIAVVARMVSLPIALAGGLVLGVLESVLLFNTSASGTVEAVIFVILMITLFLQSRGGSREREQGSFLAVSSARPLPDAIANPAPVRHLGKIGVLGILAFLCLFLLGSNSDAFVMTRLISYTLVGMSVFVISGLTGQLSLGQFALAGIGAAFSIHMTDSGTNFALALILASLYTAVVSIVVGLPALRIRGLMLTVSTLAFAVMCQAWLFNQSWVFGTGKTPRVPHLPGIGRLDTGREYYLVAIPALFLGLWLTWNVTRGGMRRSLAAMRDNEDGARAFALHTTRLKLQAFGIAGFLAGLGGAVYAHSLPLVRGGTFGSAESITVVAIAAIGGITILAGSFLGALYLIGLPAFVSLSSAGLAASSLGWLLLILYFPGGLAQVVAPLRTFVIDRIAKAYGLDAKALRDAHADEHGDGEEASSVSTGGLIITTPVRATPSTAIALEARELVKSFGGIQAVRGVSFSVHKGEILGMIGPNGAGKTTTFEMLSGFTKPDSGAVLFNGTDITAFTPEHRAELGLVRSFQDARLFPTMTVAEVVDLAFEKLDPSETMPSLLGLPSVRRRDARVERKAREVIATMGLERYRDKPICDLSTGTRRITELACLIALEPTLLLLDEPSSGIAQRETEALGELIRTLRDYLDATVIVIEHDMPLVLGLADRVLAMETGQRMALGTPLEVISDPRVIESYLGGNVLAVERSGAMPGPASTTSTTSTASSNGSARKKAPAKKALIK